MHSTIERELAAVRWGRKVFSPFIMGTRSTLYSDHKPLSFLHNLAITNSRLMQTLQDISEYAFEIRYRPGKDNIVADALSRIGHESRREGGRESNKQTYQLPEGFMVAQKIDGGGNSMFESILYCLRHLQHISSANLEICNKITKHIS